MNHPRSSSCRRSGIRVTTRASLVRARLLDAAADVGEVAPVLAAVVPPAFDPAHCEVAALRVFDALGPDDAMDAASIVSELNDTLRKPVTVWVVPYEDSLYVRSVSGPSAAWYRGTQERHEGHIRADGVEKDVTFLNADHDIDDEVDAAYRTKYRRYAGRILNSVLTPQARSTTLKLVPRTKAP